MRLVDRFYNVIAANLPMTTVKVHTDDPSVTDSVIALVNGVAVTTVTYLTQNNLHSFTTNPVRNQKGLGINHDGSRRHQLHSGRVDLYAGVARSGREAPRADGFTGSLGRLVTRGPGKNKSQLSGICHGGRRVPGDGAGGR